jgi:D-lyxose ketol-isomerase
MGLDLSLLPFLSGKHPASHEIIAVKDYTDVVAVNEGAFPQIEVEEGFNSFVSRNDDYEESHYGETLRTPYGEPLMWTYARHLKPIITHGTAAAYLSACRDEDKIALWWH